jgi:hypothetical protein
VDLRPDGRNRADGNPGEPALVIKMVVAVAAAVLEQMIHHLQDWSTRRKQVGWKIRI